MRPISLEAVLIFAVTLVTSVFAFVIIIRWFNISRFSRPSVAEQEAVISKNKTSVLSNPILLLIAVLIVAIVALRMYAG